MTLSGIFGLQRGYRWIRKAIAPGALILLYHSVANVDCDPWSISVSPEHLAEHLETLKKYQCMRLGEFCEKYLGGRTSRAMVAVTFDDGYANNLYEAKPLLERHDIPATVFVSSGYTGMNREFWWDELEQIILHPRILPENLSLQMSGTLREWTLRAAADYSADGYRRDVGRHVREAEPGSRLGVYHSIWQQLSVLANDQLRNALDEIAAWASMNPTVRQTHRPLTSEEVVTLEQGRLVEVGAHSVTHPLLDLRPMTAQRDEIRQSKADLESILDHPVSSFSFPHGKYTTETLTCVREAGFTRACTSHSDPVRRHADPLQLPRIEVRDMDGEEFAKKLSEWLLL